MVIPKVASIEQLEKARLLLYTPTKYQFARESSSPVAGITRFTAQKPFSSPEGTRASHETPHVIAAKEANSSSDCSSDAA